MNDDMLALAARVEAGHGLDNSLDVEIEAALFEPEGIAVSARPNAAGTKVIYTYVDGIQATYWPRNGLPTAPMQPPPSALAPAWEGSSMWTNWQAQAQKHIAKFMADVPATATWQERQKILRANAWQFTGGTSWGKRVWAKHCKAYLAMHGKPMGAKEAERKEPLFAADITFPFRTP